MTVKIPLSKIIIGDRFRKAYTNIDELAASISEVGLIEPIIIDRNYNLIVGGRRFKAIAALEWDEIEEGKHFLFREDLDDWQRRKVELEENLQRENLTDVEELEAKLRLHELYQERYGAATKTKITDTYPEKTGWGVKDTAALLRESIGEVSEDIILARAIRKDPSLAEKVNEVGKKTAYRIMKTQEEVAINREIARILAEDAKERGEEDIKVILGDSRMVLKEFEDESFDFCVTDPPYAVGLDDTIERDHIRLHKQWSPKWIGRTYEDPKELDVHKVVYTEVYRVLKPNSHFYTFFPTSQYAEFRFILEEIGFNVRGIPLLWIKMPLEMCGLANSPYYEYGRMYESIFFCTKKGSRKFNFPGRNNIFPYEIPKDKAHPAERPLGLLKDLILNCSHEGEIGLDPFAGGGSFAVAAAETGRRAVVIEKEETYYLEILKKLSRFYETKTI